MNAEAEQAVKPRRRWKTSKADYLTTIASQRETIESLTLQRDAANLEAFDLRLDIESLRRALADYRRESGRLRALVVALSALVAGLTWWAL